MVIGIGQISCERPLCDSSANVTMNESNKSESSSLSVIEKRNANPPEQLSKEDYARNAHTEQPSMVSIESSETFMQQSNTDDITIPLPSSIHSGPTANVDDNDPSSLCQEDSDPKSSLTTTDVTKKSDGSHADVKFETFITTNESRNNTTLSPNSEKLNSDMHYSKNPVHVRDSSCFGYDSQVMDDLMKNESPNILNDQQQHLQTNVSGEALSLSTENDEKVAINSSKPFAQMNTETRNNEDVERMIALNHQEELIDKINHIPNFDRNVGCINKSIIDTKSYQITRIRLGICAMDKKARSKPFAEILSRLEEKLFEIIFFGDDCILNKPVETWPMCDVLIAFFSKGYPIDKVKSYVKTRNIKFNLNNLDMQKLLQDRRRVYDLLEASGIDVPKHVYLSRDGYVSTGTGSGNKKLQQEKVENGQIMNEEVDNKQNMGEDILVEFDDHIEINGISIHKPFVEKPANAEDHNISIYYPTSKLVCLSSFVGTNFLLSATFMLRQLLCHVSQ